jgi:Domain of unknown function (DUF4260)
MKSMKGLLQAEGLALFIAALVAYHGLDGPWLMFIVMFLVPDVSFIGYLVNARVGATIYNLLHSTIGPLLLLGLSRFMVEGDGSDLALLLSVIWLAHIGFDRMLGYGLKHFSGFKDTHLGPL